MCDPWDSLENEKNAISISIAFCLDFLIRNENITCEKCKQKTAGFSLVGGDWGIPPMSLMSPLIRTVSPPIKSESCPPSSH